MTDITKMTKQERLEAVVTAFSRPDGGLDDQFALANVGLSNLAKKDNERNRRPSNVRKIGQFVVQHPDNKHVYLGKKHVDGTPVRQWSADDPRIFHSQREAENAVELKGSGKVLPLAKMTLRADVLRGEGLVRELSR